MSEGNRKPLRLPFDFGDVVYLRHKPEKVAGMVTGFIVRENRVIVLVTWVDSRHEEDHNVFELVEEFEPSYNTEP